ncbi:MAG: transporter [Fimbriimonadales bacterium]
MKLFFVFFLSVLFLPGLTQEKKDDKKEDKTPPINPDRPDLTNGPGITPIGKFVLEMGYRQTRSGGATLHEWGDGPTWRYGVNDRLELRFVSPAYAVDSFGNKGFEDTNIGFKWLLKDGGDGGGFKKPSYALQAGTSMPSGSNAFRSKQPLPIAIGIVDFDLGTCGDLGANVSAGSQLNGNGSRFTMYTASLSYNHSVGGPVTAYFESYMLIPTGAGNGSAGHFVDSGLQYLLNNDCMLDASVGTQIDRHQQSSYFDLGVSFRF